MVKILVKQNTNELYRLNDFSSKNRLYNDSPVRDTIVTNDRWGKGTLCEHGDFITCSDRFNPGMICKFMNSNNVNLINELNNIRRFAKA